MIHVSQGNSKIGNVPSISFMPDGETCRRNAVCRNHCYGRNLIKFRPSLAKNLRENEAAWKASKEVFENQLRSHLILSSNRFFRYFVFGDIPDYSFYVMMIRLADEFENIKFMGYTSHIDLNYYSAPNLVLRSSIWPNDTVKTERYYHSANIVKTPTGFNFLCPGSCPKCGFTCWNEQIRTIEFKMR